MSPLSRRKPLAATTIESRIREALEGVRSLLPIDTARLELVEFRAESGVAVVRLSGDCPDCRLSVAMLREGIEAHVRARVPEISEIKAI